MSPRDDAFEAWRQRARDADILDVAVRVAGAKLRKRAREHIGPCPRCGGTDRFSINTGKMVFNCRGAAGGDAIAMVMHACAVEFLAACEMINGEPPPEKGTQLTEEAKAAADKARAASAARAARRDADENAYRQRERETVAGIWDNAHPLPGSSAEDYLALRGLTFPPTAEGRADRIRCVEAMPYNLDKETIIHRGPAMVMPIVDAKRVFRGLHFTYLDLTTPKGKLVLEHESAVTEKNPRGLLDAKKSRGLKHGNHVELIGPIEPTRLIMGEGAEKVIAVWQALDRHGLPVGGIPLHKTAFWSACDLGNLAGNATDKLAHPTLKQKNGRTPIKVLGLVPDFDAPGIAIPDSVTDLVLLGDTTSDAFTTQLAMLRAAARYAKPGRTVRVAWAPAEHDFDDLFRLAATDGDRQQAAAIICGIVDTAIAPVLGSELRDYAAARASDSEPQRAAEVSPRETGGEAAPNVLSFPGTKRASSEPEKTDSSFSASSSPHPSGGQESTATLANDDEGEPPDDDSGISEETFRYCAGLDHSDTDNATRLIAYLGRDLLVRQEDDVPAGQWLAWTGTHWDLAGGEALAHLLAQQVGDLIKIEARYIDFTEAEARAVTAADIAVKNLKTLDPMSDDADVLATIEELKEIVAKGQKARNALASRKTNRRKWGVGTKNAARIGSMLKCAAPRLRTPPDDFNKDQLKVATLTHTLSFERMSDPENPDADGERAWIDPETGRSRYRLIARKGHDRADLLTAVIPYAYDEKATCAAFSAFLDLFQPEPEKRRTVQQYAGIGMTGQPVQLIMFHTGTGGNGKSVFLEVMTRVLGDGLAVSIPSESVSGDVQNNPSAPTPDIARCYGKRFIRIAELPKDEPLKQNTIKRLTGGERWAVRTMYKGYFEFKPIGKPHMSGNAVPQFDGTDGGLRRRLIFMPWSVTLAADLQRDFEEVVGEIVAGGSGIVNWLIAGALDFLNKGLVISKDVAETTAEQFADRDPCQQFINAHVRPDENGPGVAARAMYDAYRLWCTANGLNHMFEARFGRTMKAKLKRDDSKRVHVYVNVALHDLPEKASDHRDGEPPPHPGNDKDEGF